MAQPTFRTATRADVPAILELLGDDDIARSRGVPEPASSGVPEPASSGVPEPASSGVPESASSGVPESDDARLWAAFEAIDEDSRNDLIVADDNGRVVGTCQLTFTPSLSRGGSERMTIEAVRVHADLRGRGVGRAMMLWSLDRARERGCRLAQLTTDKRRVDAHRFYASLGFQPSHEGFKIAL